MPSGVTQAIFSMAMLVVQSLTNSFGEAVIACNVIVMRVDGFAIMPNFTFGQALDVYKRQPSDRQYAEKRRRSPQSCTSTATKAFNTPRKHISS